MVDHAEELRKREEQRKIDEYVAAQKKGRREILEKERKNRIKSGKMRWQQATWEEIENNPALMAQMLRDTKDPDWMNKPQGNPDLSIIPPDKDDIYLGGRTEEEFEAHMRQLKRRMVDDKRKDEERDAMRKARERLGIPRLEPGEGAFPGVRGNEGKKGPTGLTGTFRDKQAIGSTADPAAKKAREMMREITASGKKGLRKGEIDHMGEVAPVATPSIFRRVGGVIR